MKAIVYKGYNIVTDEGGNSYIYDNGELKGATHTDYLVNDSFVSKPKNNSEKKAKLRIDNNKLNNLK